MKTELLNWITLAVAVAGLVLGVVNLILLLRIGKWLLRKGEEVMRTGRQEQSALGQWKQGVERQLGRLDGTVTRLTAAADRCPGSSDGREE